MNNYIFDTGSKQIQGSHTLLLGPPLFIISLFCFGLVLVQPTPPPQIRKTASRQSAAQSVKQGHAQPKSQISHISNADIPKVAAEPAAPTPAPPPKPAASITSSPQASNASLTSLQSAKPNNQTKPAGVNLEIPKPHVAPIINSLGKTIR